ncbi:NADPH-dependent F420 reductase [Pseudogemmobacter sonorensis]|uniref:NADPH-dependent F420 reductase n=1 Tax=Pseudogemmobacter sonorensis TaxID=2989681 RepID=UPI0036AD8F24
MHIVILGKGNMGTPLAALAEKAGHGVEAYGSEGAPLEALRQADIVVIATKYEQALKLAETPGTAEALVGKIVIDITNPLASDFMSLTVGHTSSAVEEIARRMPNARIVKAFNTVFASVIALRAEGRAVASTVFVTGNDAAAIETVAALVREPGFEAVPARVSDLLCMNDPVHASSKGSMHDDFQRNT